MKVPIRILVLLITGVVVSSGSSRGEFSGEGAPESPLRPDQEVLIIEKIRDSRPLSGADLRELGGTVIQVEDTRVKSRYIEGEYPEEKKIHLLKVEKEDGDIQEMLMMQKSLLRSQLVLLKTLGVIVRHQAGLERRLARNENMMRDQIMGAKDSADSLNMMRLDTSSTSAGIDDLSEITVEISDVVGDIQKKVSEL